VADDTITDAIPPSPGGGQQLHDLFFQDDLLSWLITAEPFDPLREFFPEQLVPRSPDVAHGCQSSCWLSHDLGDSVAADAYCLDAWEHGWQQCAVLAASLSRSGLPSA
jgi:hypothetical protein